MSKTWFVFVNNTPTGPYSTAEIQAKLASGQLTKQDFIWWKGLREWLPITNWLAQLPSLEAANASEEEPVWQVDLGTATIGPLTKSQLIQELLNVKNLSQVRLWTPWMSDWCNLFEVDEIRDSLNASRRKHERAPFMGTVTFKRRMDPSKNYCLKMVSISLGGIGCEGEHNFKPGEVMELLIESPGVPSKMNLSAEVIHVRPNGYVGARFLTISPEIQKALLEYVLKFMGPPEGGP